LKIRVSLVRFRLWAPLKRFKISSLWTLQPAAIRGRAVKAVSTAPEKRLSDQQLTSAAPFGQHGSSEAGRNSSCHAYGTSKVLSQI
jgi:hypothetical protein